MGKDLHLGRSAWPSSGGEMGARIRAFDWEKTPLGPIASWPQSLKTTIDLMMASQLAMNLIWGPERILIYNEVHRAFMGTKHPRAFGRPGREVWGEVWEAAEAAIHCRVFAGETVTLEDHPWTLLRNGGPEEAFFTSYFTPIRDETGAIVANLATAFETTNAVKEKAERDQAERALRKSEARLREVLEGIGEAFYALDQDLRFLYASRKALEIWDKKPDDLIGVPFLSAFPNAVGTPDYEAQRRALQTGTAQHFESSSPLIGHLFEVDIYPTSTGVSVAFRDIDRRKKAEALLRASEARLKAAVELIGLSPYSGDPRTGALDWDARLKAMWGLPAGTTVDAPMAVAAIHRDDQARVAAAWEASLDPDSDGVFVAEYRVQGIEDGIERWVSTHAQNFFEGRQPVGFIGAIREITEEKHAEARLRESEARLKAAVDLARLGRYAWNPQTNELQWDDTLRAMWGLAAGTPVDYEVWRAGVHPDDLARVEAAVQRCVDPRGDGVYDIEYRVIGKTDGVERWIATRGRTNFENEAPVAFFGIALEVTERKRIEEGLERRIEDRRRELEEANRQLRSQMEKREFAETVVQQLQRLDAIGQITSGVAHDFNNLLTVVLTNARLLARTMERPDDREGIELIRTAADRGRKLVAQLLAFSRKQQLAPLEVDLNSKIAGIGDLLGATLGGTVQLKTIFAPDLWPALVDPNQIEMIVLNLVINARDAMQPGDTLTIETLNTVIESESLRPEEPLPGDYVVLAVKDTGTGIPDDVLLHVFEPFYTTKEPGKGSGLGLAQVFGFAKQSGGGVRIETRLGEGTAVKVFLPRAEVDIADHHADTVDASKRLQTAKRFRVLVVDDEKAVLRSMVRMLDVLGYATLSAESGGEALRMLASNQEIDLVLADLAMPEMSGGELAKAIRAMLPTLPIILITGYSDRPVPNELNDLRIILKPFTEDELVNAIGAALV
ncbi:PAS domain S-box protein [Bradyrhizobium brasilense]|uniref:hybrid sensor histidine kinase/response regulator n=1 Tax=Bradyrhizobium brasilense TaxID=1419277 RepID=UPI0024B041EC|nr:PAS domain S-box protein [Bradyrhizobium australafricanum]WFU34402.1 PAS domain S-box protein [Bradyrhizobium australafricanum]